MSEYVAPKFNKKAFHCPCCGVYASQVWNELITIKQMPLGNKSIAIGCCAICFHCNLLSIWFNKKMIYPLTGNAPLPNQDIPNEIKIDYEEARSIVNLSPRGAAALLRLAIQKLCKHLGEEGKNLNNDIGKLVEKGLPKRIQQALDIVRVTGNESVHPGELDIRDDPETAQTLFKLVNLIIDDRITQQREIQEIFDSLPESKKQAIQKRDGQ